MRYMMLVVLAAALLLPETASATGGRRNRCGCHGSYTNGCYGCHGSCHGGHRHASCWGGSCWGRSACWGGRSGCHGTAYHSAPRTSYYYDPATGTSSIRTSNYYESGTVMPASNQAWVEVNLPDANAELFIQGEKSTSTGLRRAFSSPDLEEGKTYTYTMKLQRNNSGRIEEDTRTIEVRAGSRLVVDFTQPKTTQPPAPEPPK